MTEHPHHESDVVRSEAASEALEIASATPVKAFCSFEVRRGTCAQDFATMLCFLRGVFWELNNGLEWCLDDG